LKFAQKGIIQHGAACYVGMSLQSNTCFTVGLPQWTRHVLLHNYSIS